jgi:excisionase family DNA binding protein
VTDTIFIDALADAVAQRVIAQLAAQKAGSSTRRLMAAAEAAEYIGRSKQALYHLVSQGKIPVKRNGSRLFFDRVELDAWITGMPSGTE